MDDRSGESSNLDLLRACAVGLVVFSHTNTFLAWAPEGFSLAAFGRLGVAIFFVHTSLVLMMSLQRSGSATSPFLIRRFFRIYPLSVTIVLIMLLLTLLTGTQVDGGRLLSNILLIQNLTGHASSPGPLWSLPYEFQMYLLLPLLYGATLLRRPALRIALVWAGSVALALAAWATNSYAYDLVKFAPCFMPGVLAFVLVPQIKARFSPLLLFSVVAVAALALPLLVARGAPLIPLLWAVCLALGLVIPMCRQLEIPSLAKGAKFVATYSYGIYLTHLLARGFTRGAMDGWPWLVQLAVYLTVILVLSIAAYRWIEQPGIRLGVRLADKWATRAVAVRPRPEQDARGGLS